MMNMDIMKKLLDKLGMLFSRKRKYKLKSDTDSVAEMSFSIDKESNIFIACSYEEEEEVKNLFAELYIHVNCGSLSSEILEIIHEQSKKEDKLEEYADLLAKISELYRLHLKQEIATSERNDRDESSMPLVKPTEVIAPEAENNDLF